jgi:hypothetical protein
MSERGRGADFTAWMRLVSPTIISKKTHDVDLSSCSPVRKMQSNEGLLIVGEK